VQLETQLETQEAEHSKSQRSVRNVDRTVKDLQSQIERKDKQAGQLAEDSSRLRDKVDKLLKTIEELQASESDNQLTARRAEREMREEKEKAARLERELEGWKNLRMEKGSINGSVSGSRLGTPSLSNVRRISKGTWQDGADDASSISASGTGVYVPRRKSSLERAPSLTKGFL
jgi:myosin heavy chain 9/10/11/14